MAVERFISHNRALIPVFASSMNVGTLINYSSDTVVKVYKVGYSLNALKSQNANIIAPKLYFVSGIGTFETTIISEIYPYESGSFLNGSIIHGSGGIPVSATPENEIKATSKTLLRRSYFYAVPVYSYPSNIQGFSTKYLSTEANQVIYEHNNSDTQPLTLRQGDGLIIINDVYSQATGYVDNFFEFTTE